MRTGRKPQSLVRSRPVRPQPYRRPRPFLHPLRWVTLCRTRYSATATAKIGSTNEWTAADSYCNALFTAGDLLPKNYHHQQKFLLEYNSSVGPVEILILSAVKPQCDWPYNFDECKSYLGVPVDSYNCGDVDWKQGRIVDNNCYKWRISLKRWSDSCGYS